MIGQQPFFELLTNPDFAGALSPEGQMNAEVVQQLIQMTQGPASISQHPRHVQTSPGVYESAYRVAGRPDPRFDNTQDAQAQLMQQLLGGSSQIGGGLHFGAGGGTGGAGLHFGGRS